MSVGDYVEVADGKDDELFLVLEHLAGGRVKIQNALNNNISILDSSSLVPSGTHARISELHEWVLQSHQTSDKHFKQQINSNKPTTNNQQPTTNKQQHSIN